MRQKYRSRQTRARRRGFTLLELLIASTCTVAIATAGTTMTLAVANAVQSAPDNAAVVITGHGAVNRAAKYVRQSRLVGYYDATQAALWVGDKNNDDRTQLSETAVLWYDSSSQEMRWSKPFSDSTSAATITASDRVVPLTELTTAAFLDTVRKSTYVGTAVLAGGATQLTISGNASTTGAELLDVRLQLTSSQGPLSFVTTASPRAMGDYLTSSSKYTNDGVATKRLRRTSLRFMGGAAMIDAPIDGIQSKAYARWRGRRSNGFVMVLVVGFAALVMTTVTAYLALNSPALPMAMNQASAVRARYLAGSGIALATHYLAKPPTSVTVGHYWTGVTGFSIDASSDTVDVTVTRSATAQENYLVSATGTDLDASGAVRGKAAITTEIVTPPPPYFTLPQLFVSSSSIAIPDNLTFNGIVHANGNINCAAAVSGTVSATGTVAYSGGGSPTKTPSAAAIAMPTLSSVAWSRYVVNGVVRNATTFNSGNLTGANVASVGGNSSVTIVYQSDGSVAFLDTSGLTGLLGTLGNVVTSLTGITGAQHVAPSVITANNPGGVLVYNGNLTMPAGNAGLIGSLVVIGDLRIRDASNFCAMPGYPALVVTGDIRIDDNQKVEIDGPILYGGTFIGQKPGLTVNGPVRSYGAGFDKDFGKNINLVTRLAGIDIVFNASSTFQNYYDFSNTTPQPMTLLSWSEP